MPDSLKTGVAKPDLYDPKINRSYVELALSDAATRTDLAESATTEDFTAEAEMAEIMRKCLGSTSAA